MFLCPYPKKNILSQASISVLNHICIAIANTHSPAHTQKCVIHLIRILLNNFRDNVSNNFSRVLHSLTYPWEYIFNGKILFIHFFAKKFIFTFAETGDFKNSARYIINNFVPNSKSATLYERILG